MTSPSLAQRVSSMESSDNRHHLLRSPSASSDITIRSVNVAVPPTNPTPAYVARHAAAELIASEIDRPVFVATSALNLVNEFLDQVLFNILVTSRSTTLSSLKIAVPTVLKPRLGKAAVRSAEEELKEYLNDDEEIELRVRSNPGEFKHDFDPDLAWKLARLRCMVYARLGDLEEEDEEEWLEKEGLLDQLQRAKQTSQATIETGPASAIFLTSVIEYLGEQALYYAAQHAQKRNGQNGSIHMYEDDAEPTDPLPNPDDLVVSGKDMNHVGRDSPLSRLWRSYRRNTRESTSRPMTPEVRAPHGLGLSHSRAPSSVAQNASIPEERSPDQIPLPISINDIDEIEVPGLAPAFSDDEDDGEDELVRTKRRPASMIDIPAPQAGDSAFVDVSPPAIPTRSPLRPTWILQRSISSPVTNLDKAGASRKNSSARVETLGSKNLDTDSMPQQDSGSRRRRSSSIAERRLSTSGEPVFGGAAPSIASALGMGVLGIPGHTSTATQSLPRSERAELEVPASLESVEPKRTVAEEMLGSKRAVPPPIDATTGASITNVSDFASMHLPLAISPMPSAGPASPTTPSRETGPGPEGDFFLRDDDILGNTAASGRVVSARPGTSGSDRRAPLVAGDRRVTESRDPVSAVSTNNSRPQSSGSAGVGMGIPTIIAGSSIKEPTQIRHTKADSRGSIKAPHSRESSNGSRTLGFNKDSAIHPQTVTQQRSVGLISDEARSTPSTSGLGVVRDTHPSTSNSSGIKRIQGKPLPIGEESDEAKKKSLEILIRGNETLHYTLTPAAALRDEQSTTQKGRTQTQDMADFFRNTGPPVQDANARARLGGLSSNPPDPPASPRNIVQRTVIPSSPKGVVAPPSPTRTRNPLGEPRDARTEQTTAMRDLADYARSTGPLDSKQLPLPIAPKSVTSTSPRAATAKSRPESVAQEAPTSNTKKPVNRLKYQARDARAARNDETSDLIDFIREGPPSVNREGPSGGREHRIDRKVAPFRTTMDSEDFDNLVQGRPIGSSLRDSEDGHPAASLEPSVSSQTPLILSNGQTGRGTSITPTARQPATDSDGMPQRTRRRIKDPYAIYDSEDEDEDELASKQSRNHEESLIDFLRNTAPPPELTTKPILSDRTDQRSPVLPRMALAREESPHLTQTGSERDKYRPTQPTHAPHVDRNRANPTNRANPISPSTASNNRNSSKPRFEARDAKATRAGTSELAEYLKNSGPPPNAEYQPQPFVLNSNSPPQMKIAQPKVQTPAPKEEKSLFKRFSKSKR